jgi:hypothetical protein
MSTVVKYSRKEVQIMRSWNSGYFAIWSLFAVALASCGHNDSDTHGGAGTGGTTAASATTGSSGGANATTGSSGTSGVGGAAGGSIDYGTALLGTWKSKDCEPSAGTSTRRRTYVFTPDDVKITYELFAGSACEAGPTVLVVTTHGDAQFVGPSSSVPGATNVLFTFKSRAVKPSAAGVNLLKGACGQYAWTADTEVDVSKDGCGMLVQSNTECPVEYDLASLVGDVAYFGDRMHPLCSDDTRPTMVAPWGVVKQP